MAKKNEVEVVETTEVVEAKKELTQAQAEKLVTSITNKYNKIDKSFLGIMGDVAKAYEYGVHTYYGYTSFYDMANDLWGIGKTSVKNMVMINRRFGENYKILPQWQEYGTSKLLLIKDLQDDVIEALEITPDLTRQDIKDKVDEYNGVGVNDDPVGITTSADTEDGEVSDDEVNEAMEAARPIELTLTLDTVKDLYGDFFNLEMPDNLVVGSTIVINVTDELE